MFIAFLDPTTMENIRKGNKINAVNKLLVKREMEWQLKVWNIIRTSFAMLAKVMLFSINQQGLLGIISSAGHPS